MSLKRDREPVELHRWDPGEGYRWIKVRRYIIHRNGNLSYLLSPTGHKWCAAPDYWRKVKDHATPKV